MMIFYAKKSKQKESSKPHQTFSRANEQFAAIPSALVLGPPTAPPPLVEKNLGLWTTTALLFEAPGVWSTVFSLSWGNRGWFHLHTGR